MIDDERLQKSVELMQDATMVICSDDQAVAMLAAIMMTTSMAKEQKFPISFLHKMIDEFAAAWDENMPTALRN